MLVHAAILARTGRARHAQSRPTGCASAPASAASTQSQSCASVAAASAVISAWSNGGDTSTMSMPTRSQPGEPAHQLQRLPAREPARHRRAGARREGRVEPVDVEGEIDRRVAGARAHHLERRGDAVAVRSRAPSGSRAPRPSRGRCGSRPASSAPRSTSPSRIARPIIVPWSIRPGSSGQRSPCASTCTSASGP